MDQTPCGVYADMDFHPEIPLFNLLSLVLLWILLAQLVFVELVAANKVASLIVPGFMAKALALRWAMTVSTICWRRLFFYNRCRKAKIAV